MKVLYKFDTSTSEKCVESAKSVISFGSPGFGAAAFLPDAVFFGSFLRFACFDAHVVVDYWIFATQVSSSSK
jgi:hypothetical protein